MKRLCTLLLLSALSTYAIGYQHGIFASQSTQGTQWRGTSAIVAEHYSITVMPSYTLSGRLLVIYKDKTIINGILQLSLPDAVRFSKQTLLITIHAGGMNYTRTIAMQ